VNKILHLITLALLTANGAVLAEETLPLKSVNKANEVIDAALAAHGGEENLTNLNSLVQESTLVTYATNQSRLPNPPWDKGKQSSTNAIDFEEGVFFNRTAGSGGGFEFDAATVINEEDSWQLDYRAGTAAPISEPDLNTTAGPFIRVTPALLMKQLQGRRQQSNWLGIADFDGRPHDVITLVMEVGPALALYIDQESHMLTRMERVLPPFGQVEYRFEDYTMVDGVAFNQSFKLLLNGDDNLDISNARPLVNVPVEQYTRVASNLEVIDAVVPDDFNLQELDEGVFLVGGNGAYGLFVEMQDHLVAIGGTQGAADRLKEVRKHIPDKPVRYGVLTHHHSDHVPASADYAKEGATIITFEPNQELVRAAAGDDSVKLAFVEDRMTLGDGERTIELYDIGPTPHAEQMLIVYLPEEGIIFEADHFPQPRTGPLPPAVSTTLAFVAALEELDLEYSKVVGAHSSRVGTPADVSSVVLKKPATQSAGAL